MQHKEQLGFLTIAENTSEVDYLSLAYLQALNVKCTQKQNKYAVVVDKKTAELLTDRHRRVFDYVIEIENNYNSDDSKWRLANECQTFSLTPFKETIKLESDLLFTSSIDHWLPSFRLRDVLMPLGCLTSLGIPATSREYRRFFDSNSLPDVYTGLMYFRFSHTGANFFRTANQIREHWDELKNKVLKNCREDVPSTDVLYAVTAQMIGVENVTLPSLDFIKFAHMKPEINGYNVGIPWYDAVMSERDGDMIRINGVNQYWPVHYYEKEYATQELIEYYERRAGII
jgi:hypothetical protein